MTNMASLEATISAGNFPANIYSWIASKPDRCSFHVNDTAVMLNRQFR